MEYQIKIVFCDAIQIIILMLTHKCLRTHILDIVMCTVFTVNILLTVNTVHITTSAHNNESKDRQSFNITRAELIL